MATPVALQSSPIAQFFTVNGVPLSGGKLFTYAAGTTTKLTSYTDSTGATPQTNPITLNSRGEPENGLGASIGIWLQAATAYKLVLSPSTDTDPPTNPIWTLDNVTAGLAGAPISASVSQASALPLTNNVTTNITSISLPPGNYLVFSSGWLNMSGATATYLEINQSTTSAFRPTPPNSGGSASLSASITSTGNTGLGAGPMYLSLTTTTNVFLTMFALFSGGTATGYGYIAALPLL